MIEPENVIIRCPNGHELQAAKTDIDKTLSCPVCSVTFIPNASGGAEQQASLNYASELTEPVTYPAVTKWMVVLWLLVMAMQTIMNIWSQTDADLSSGNIQGAGSGIALLGVSCFLMMAGLAATIMHLVWIYKIHADAVKARNYNGPSPGWALTFSFVPVWNFIWTGILMRKLAAFAATPERSEEPPVKQAKKGASLTLVFGIILAASTLFGIGYTVYLTVDSLELQQKAQATGAAKDTKAVQDYMEEHKLPLLVQAPIALLWVAGVLIYSWSVIKLEKSLYPHLGALEP